MGGEGGYDRGPAPAGPSSAATKPPSGYQPTPEDRAQSAARDASSREAARAALALYEAEPALHTLSREQRFRLGIDEPARLRVADQRAEHQGRARASADGQERGERQASEAGRAHQLVAHLRAAVAEAVPSLETQARQARIAGQLKPEGTQSILAAVASAATGALVAALSDDAARSAVQVVCRRLRDGETVDALGPSFEAVAERLAKLLPERARAAGGSPVVGAIPEAAELGETLARAGLLALAQATGQSVSPPTVAGASATAATAAVDRPKEPAAQKAPAEELAPYSLTVDEFTDYCKHHTSRGWDGSQQAGLLDQFRIGRAVQKIPEDLRKRIRHALFHQGDQTVVIEKIGDEAVIGTRQQNADRRAEAAAIMEGQTITNMGGFAGALAEWIAQKVDPDDRASMNKASGLGALVDNIAGAHEMSRGQRSRLEPPTERAISQHGSPTQADVREPVEPKGITDGRRTLEDFANGPVHPDDRERAQKAGERESSMSLAEHAARIKTGTARTMDEMLAAIAEGDAPRYVARVDVAKKFTDNKIFGRADREFVFAGEPADLRGLSPAKAMEKVGWTKEWIQKLVGEEIAICIFDTKAPVKTPTGEHVTSVGAMAWPQLTDKALNDPKFVQQALDQNGVASRDELIQILRILAHTPVGAEPNTSSPALLAKAKNVRELLKDRYSANVLYTGMGATMNESGKLGAREVMVHNNETEFRLTPENHAIVNLGKLTQAHIDELH